MRSSVNSTVKNAYVVTVVMGYKTFAAFLQEETIEEFSSSGIDPLTVSLYQMDLDRTQYLLRSYLRARLQKVAISSSIVSLLVCLWMFCGNLIGHFLFHLKRIMFI
jgi:hypothetical protein